MEENISTLRKELAKTEQARKEASIKVRAKTMTSFSSRLALKSNQVYLEHRSSIRGAWPTRDYRCEVGNWREKKSDRSLKGVLTGFLSL